MKSFDRILDPEGKPLYPREEIQPIAEALIYHCRECFIQSEICGFIRREEKYTYDIGIVSQIKSMEAMFWFSTLLANPPDGVKVTDLEVKARKAEFYCILEDGAKIHCDWNFMPDELQFEVFKLYRTGGWEFVMEMEQKAKEVGLYFRHGGKYELGTQKTYILWGLYSGQEVWDDDMGTYKTILNPLNRVAATERAIIEKIYGYYIEPVERMR